MTNDEFKALCRRYQAAFAQLVPLVDAEGCQASEARVVSDAACCPPSSLTLALTLTPNLILSLTSTLPLALSITLTVTQGCWRLGQHEDIATATMLLCVLQTAKAPRQGASACRSRCDSRLQL